MKKILVSVIIPVYNGELYIKKAIESIIKSTFTNFEIILVNDGSTDGSEQICLTLNKKYRKIKLFSFRKNQGLSNVLNYAIKKAKGDYIARLNQDDLMEKHRLQKQVSFLEKNKDHVMVGGSLKLIDEHGKTYDVLHFPKNDKDIRKHWMVFSPFADPTVMYRKIAFFKTKKYNQTFYPADDYQLWFQMGKFGKLANLKETMTLMRIHKQAATIKAFHLFVRKTWEIHQWSVRYVQKPSFFIRFFWLSQYICGNVLPVNINLFINRLIKKIYFPKVNS